MVRYAAAVFLSFWVVMSSAEPVWTKVKVPEFGVIEIPDVMEIQSKYIMNLVDKISEDVDAVIQGDRVTIQQRGVNEKSEEALTHFVRFIVVTQYGNAGDYIELSNPISITKNDLESFNEEVKGNVIKEYSKYNLKIGYWRQASMGKIGSYDAIMFNYERSITNNKPVTVEKYWVPNNDRVHTIEIQYRTDEKGLWLPFLNKMKNSIQIIHR